LSRALPSTVSPALRTLSTRSPLLVLTSRKPTTSSGPSSLTHPRRASLLRDILTKRVAFGATERTSSTSLLRECSEQHEEVFAQSHY
jgi:hypothetical protein